MIKSFSVKNFYSFKNEVTLSYVHPANPANSFKQNTIYEYYDDGKKSVLNGALLIGANASGKSNLLVGINKMSAYIKSSYKYDTEEDIHVGWPPFKFNNDNNLTSFEIELIFDKNNHKGIKADYIVKYGFEFNNATQHIENEYLSYKKILKTKLTSENIIFERTNDKIKQYSASIAKIMDKIEKENLNHKLILSLASYDINKNYYEEEVNSLEYNLIQSFIDTLTEKVQSSQSKLTDRFLKLINTDREYKDYVLNNLKDFDFAIKDFEVEDITDDLIGSLQSSSMNGEVIDNLIEKLKVDKKYRAMTIHEVDGIRDTLPYELESHGTQKFLRDSLNMYEALLTNGFYIADEFESAYHFKIQVGIINNFINQEGQSQFLLVSHNPYLLDKDLFAKEQIIFLDKDLKTETSELYNLSDFEVTYNNHSWPKLYLEGRFGAVPEVIF